MDFAKLVEVLDRHGTAFVSISQTFNTTTLMGRLTLKILSKPKAGFAHIGDAAR
jgi:DNA invertase Pin-like site-specific DNA recombinase